MGPAARADLRKADKVPAALVTKLVPARALHMVAAFFALDPVLALWALLHS